VMIRVGTGPGQSLIGRVGLRVGLGNIEQPQGKLALASVSDTRPIMPVVVQRKPKM